MRYTVLIFCIVSSLFVFGEDNLTPASKKENFKAERNDIRKGNNFYNDQKFTEAEIEYRKSLDANPSSMTGTYNLGSSLYKQEKWKDARNEYMKVVQATKDSLQAARAWHNLGNISLKEENYEQSIKEYKNALRRNPADNETRYNLRLAQLLLQKQQQEQQQNQDKDKDKQDQNKDQQNKEQNKDRQDRISKIRIRKNLRIKINRNNNSSNRPKCRKKMQSKFWRPYNRMKEILRRK